MAITNTLANAHELEEAGIPKTQAEAIAKVIEHAQFESQEDLKDFFRRELKSSLAEAKADLLIIFKDFFFAHETHERPGIQSGVE